MSRTLTLLVLITIVCNEIFAQNYPVYSSYFLNPFLYNPAAAGTDHLQVTASFRKQWVGIAGSPAISGITVSSLRDKTRTAIGFKVSNFSRGIFNSTDASLSYAYIVPLNKLNLLTFGLSGGVLSNTVNTSNLSSDPELIGTSNSFVPNASFGMLLQNSNGFNFGLVLPKLFGMQDLNSKHSYSYLDNLIVSASFSRWNPNQKPSNKRKKKNKDVPLELFSIYRYSSFGGIYEATGKYNLNSNIWISATYRQYEGIIPGLGINKDNLAFSYFYEPGLGGDLPLRTHEVQLRLKFGKFKKIKERRTIAPTSKVASNPPKAPVVGKGKSTVTPKVVAKKEPVQEPKKEPVQIAKKESIQVIKKEPIQEVKKEPIQEIKKEPVQVAKKEDVVTKEPVKEEVKKEENSFVQIRQKKDTARGGPRMKGHTDLIAEQEKKKEENDPQHLEEQEKIKRLEVHADNPTEEHNNEQVHPHAERHEFVKKGNHHEEMDYGDYVIAGAFKGRANAEHYSTGLNKMGFNSDFGFLSERAVWYVYVAQTDDINAAKAERDKHRKLKIFRDAWLLTVHK